MRETSNGRISEKRLEAKVRGSASLAAASLCLLGLLGVGCAPAASPGSEGEAPGVAVEPAESDAAIVAAVQQLLSDQVEAWNAFDLETFMEGYWNSPDLRFASGNSVRRGWQETLERYRTTYPDEAAMGTLSFDEIDVRPLGADAALAFGRFRLVRAEDEPTGLFSLVLEKKDGAWRIVHDHTSSAP